MASGRQIQASAGKPPLPPGKPGGRSTWNFPIRTIMTSTIDGCGKATQRIMLEVQIEIKKQLSKKGGGLKHSRLPYNSSSPGQPPALQTGTLRRSWQTAVFRKYAQGTRLGWRIGSNVKYARRLEFGYGFILPRPYLRPALDVVRPKVEKIMKAYVRDALRRTIPTAK